MSSIKGEIVGPWECHVQAHQSPTCDKCLYARNRRSWFKHTALDAASGCTTTWICTKPVDTLDADWGIGCKACAWAMNKSTNTVDARTIPYAMLNVKGGTLRLNNLRRHAASATHRQNTKYYIYKHCQGNSVTPLLQGAPSVEEFKTTWHDIKTVSGGTKDRKHCSMQWCLYEAWRELELGFMADAESVSIMLDERNGRLLIKYSDSNKTLMSVWVALR